MLELKKITKVYETDNFKQIALDKIDLNFRECEFASILGPSGSGKTTLLNIIGGLDHYTSGDLVINEISTKKYRDADWDSYRNHRIGFVFQNYNLISHQTILQNVLLALTLSGISKKEGIKKAKKALKDVGLYDHMHKRPNQLSGGQMQRVAIARALVNDPDILLADEPTGALDSETSIQIMNILKSVSNNKLVIMVTHNPDLAKEYSNRIITLKDGKIIDDTNPYDGKVNTKENEVTEIWKKKKTSMSFFTALTLSFNNLMTKKARTILVSAAGSIGIIGIALIASLSQGFQNYIDKLQEDTLSSYPLTISSEAADMTSMLLSMVSEESETDGTNIVKENQFLTSTFSNIKSNDLKSFNHYLKDNYNKVEKDISSIKYGYSINPLIYTIDSTKKLAKLNPSSLTSSMGISSSLYTSYSSIFSQMINDQTVLDEQYDVLAGTWPKKYNEMVIVLAEPNRISDLLVYSLGLRDTEELNEMITKIMMGETVDIKNDPLEFTYEDLLNIKMKLIMPQDLYKYNSKYEIYEDMSDDDDYMKKLYNEAEELKIVGIVCAKEGVTSMALQTGVSYTEALIDHIIENAKESEIVKKQLSDKAIDVFSNKSFDNEDEDNKSSLNFEDLISVDTNKMKSAFGSNISEKDIETLMTKYMNEIQSDISVDTTSALNDFNKTLKTFATNIFNDYIENPKEKIGDIPVIYMNDVSSVVSSFLEKEDNNNAIKKLETNYVIPSSVFKSTFESLIGGLLQGYIEGYYAIDPSITTDPQNKAALVVSASVNVTVDNFMNQALIIGTAKTLSDKMTEAVMQKEILTKVGELSTGLITKFSTAFKVDPSKIASAFKFNLTEDELKRIMTAMMTKKNNSYQSNLITLGYQDKEDPTTMSFYFNSFDSKEHFLSFLDNYNDSMEANDEEDKVLNYTDTTGILMSSVKKIVDSVSYVLIAFVSISLIVSSIMIGVITYISVLERTKEIGILRAIGASKRNISTIFNAETFIVGFLSGLIGVGFSLISIPIINTIIKTLTGNPDLKAVLPIKSAFLLVGLSIILTLIGGLIPAKKASRKDPVEALRTE